MDNRKLGTETFCIDVDQDFKELSTQKQKSGLMRHKSSNDSLLNIYFEKELSPPPPYDAHSNSTTITTTTTTTTVTTVTTTTISNPGDSTSNSSKQQDMNLNNNNSSNSNNIPNITVASYESSCATNNIETEKIQTILPENSNSANLKIPGSFYDDHDDDENKRYHKRSGSAPNVNVISIQEQTENKYKNKTVPSAKSMVNLIDSARNSVSSNHSYKETPQKYLEKLRDTLSKSELATLLTKSKDVFHETVLRTYMETFDFTKDPIDIALRKFLMDCHLPKETQQIDRVIEAFSKRYHECNPDLFTSSDVSYILAFSMLMLHTDAFNKSVKRKMTKEEFVKNTRIDGVPPDILEILYDNITFMRFIYADDDTDMNGQTMLSSYPNRNRHSMIFGLLDRSTYIKNDPYFVIRNKIPTEYTPSIEYIVTENPFSYKGTLSEFDTFGVHRAFTTAHTIRISSVRTQRSSEAFSQTSSSIHPLDDDEGTFLLKITKVGKLSRKIDLLEGKRAGVIRNWHYYGVILSGSQLMLFKDDHWFNSKIADLKDPSKSTILPTLKPDVLLMTSESVALYDKSYTKYKNVFRLVCPKGNQYLFQAESEDEMNDWITKINYAATFKTVGLKMRHIRSSSLSHAKSLSIDSKLKTLNHQDKDNMNDSHSRSKFLKSKIEEIEGKIKTLKSQLDADIRFKNNLLIMIPYKATTRDKIIHSAIELRKKIRQISMELSRLSCYHEIMENDLGSTIMGDNSYWQKRKSLKSINGDNKKISHVISKNHHNHDSYDASDGYKSDGEVSIKHRPVTFGMFAEH